MAEIPQPWVHLFTSTIRPLYIADAVAVLASAAGQHHRFRYTEEYIDPRLLADWRAGRLNGAPVAVHFSIQHDAGFHPPMIITLRRGRVIATATEGSTYTITFAVGDLLTLTDAIDLPSRAQQVSEHTAALDALLGDVGPAAGIHAVRGESPEGLATLAPSIDSGQAFETLVRYLSPALRATTPHLFLRVADLTDDDAGAARVPDPATGRVQLLAGRHHTLLLAHYQLHAPPTGVSLRIDVPASITVVGPTTIEVQSRYDLIPVHLFTPNRDDDLSGEITVSVTGPLAAPPVHLPYDVGPDNGAALATPLLGAAGAAVLLVTPALASDRHLALRLAIGAVGSVLTGAVLWARRRRGFSN